MPENPAGGSGSPALTIVHGDTPPRKRRGCGCVPGVTGALLLAIAVLVLLRPWGLHIGGRWTPALTWHGVGNLQSTSGARYGIFLELGVGGGRNHRQDFSGSGKICTPQGEVYPLRVDGYVKNAWLDLEGKRATFYVYSLKDARPKLSFTLVGSWQGQLLTLDDKGSMAMSFAPDGHAKGYLVGVNSPKETTTGSLHYAREDQFASVCGAPANGASF